ncbi:YkvA family protein [Telluribacter sp.]|uniref:YkvA family protein n=1 Tax=Telluribacter sp. TaxID=1978767 RepID=UPI002E110535|nr:YkvA family protein [Telluribacter sp.]
MRNSLNEAMSQVQLLVRMVKSYASGDYRGIASSSFVKVVASLIYFVSPIDLIPDFLPIIGLADDLALLAWLFKTLDNEIQKFNVWEKQKQVINIG